MRTFAMGDVHGAALAVEQVWERAGFDPAADRLIFLGDVADGWPEVCGAVDLLLSVENLVGLVGNHDKWFREYLRGQHPGHIWLGQGGHATLKSYGAPYPTPAIVAREKVPEDHLRYFLEDMRSYYQDGEGRMFVHGGWPGEDIAPGGGGPMAFAEDVLAWDRSLWTYAGTSGKRKVTRYPRVFLGHTSTVKEHPDMEPVRRAEIWNLDQGAGWEGKLTLMDVDTEEWWQSDRVRDLYPDDTRRR